MIDKSVFSFLENEFDIKSERKTFAFKRKGLSLESLSKYDFILNIEPSIIKENIRFFLEVISCVDLFAFYEAGSSLKVLLSFEKGTRQDFILKLNRIGETLERKGFLPRKNRYSNEYFLVECEDRLLKKHPFLDLPKIGCSGVQALEVSGLPADTLDVSGLSRRSAEGSPLGDVPVTLAADQATSNDEQVVPISIQVAPVDAISNTNNGDAEERHCLKISPSFFIQLMSHHKLALLLCTGVGLGACTLLYFGVGCLPALGIFAAGMAVGFFAASVKKSNGEGDFSPTKDVSPLK